MSRTLEQAIVWYEKFANTCRYHNLTESQEECEQLVAWLRELQERRKAPEIITCSECKHRDPEDKKCDCGHGIIWQLPRDDVWYCADAERKTE